MPTIKELINQRREEAAKERARQAEEEYRQRDPEGYAREKKRQADYIASVRNPKPVIAMPTFEQAVKIFEQATGIPAATLSATYRDTMRDVYRNLTVKEQRVGVIISSHPGTGKTTLMKAWRNLIPGQPYRVVNCLDVAEAFSKSEDGLEQFKTGRFCFDDLGNEEVKSRFGNKCDCMAEIIQFRYNRWQEACAELDRNAAKIRQYKLTEEENRFMAEKHDTQDRAQMEIFDRLFRKKQEYESLVERRGELINDLPVTHFTTNLTPDQVCATYNRIDPRNITGARVIDRMQQTCDWYMLDNEPSHRRRN